MTNLQMICDQKLGFLNQVVLMMNKVIYFSIVRQLILIIIVYKKISLAIITFYLLIFVWKNIVNVAVVILYKNNLKE